MIKKITLTCVLGFACLQLATAQTYFSDDFSSGNMNNWTLTDSDGDNNNWYVVDLDDGIQEEHATSASWIPTAPAGEALFPDNWMVSPAVDLTSASGNVFLQWKAYGQDQSWANENYTVYVATASDIATLGASTTSFNEILGASGGVYVDRNLDVTSFAGQTIYVAFRHHNVSNQFRLNIDDVVVRTVNDDDAELASIILPRYGLVNTNYPLDITVNNVGGNAITSLDVTWTDGTVTNTATITTNIAGGATVNISHPDVINYANTVEKTISVTITGVNGGADSDTSNNSQSVDFNTMTQSGTKRVLVEEGTGTWCGFCPRGAVGMDYMAANYPDTFVGVAVHNTNSSYPNPDPMTLPEYNSGILQFIDGFPSAVVDRKIVTDPNQTDLVTAHNAQITEIVPVDLSSGATQTGNTLTITANATFYTSFSAANFRLGVIISEDGVTGTTGGYAQVNYYSGEADAPGNYGSLANPVPASQMVYDHVGRALLGGFDGEANSVPTIINSGDVASQSFTYTIPATSNAANMHIVVVLIDSTDGSVVTAQQNTIAQALSVEEVSGISTIKIFPNPATDKLNIALQEGNGDYNITVTDMLGRAVINKTFTGIYGNQNLELPVSQLIAGHYIMNINDGNASYSTKFIVSK